MELDASAISNLLTKDSEVSIEYLVYSFGSRPSVAIEVLKDYFESQSGDIEALYCFAGNSNGRKRIVIGDEKVKDSFDEITSQQIVSLRRKSVDFDDTYSWRKDSRLQRRILNAKPENKIICPLAENILPYEEYRPEVQLSGHDVSVPSTPEPSKFVDSAPPSTMESRGPRGEIKRNRIEGSTPKAEVQAKAKPKMTPQKKDLLSPLQKKMSLHADKSCKSEVFETPTPTDAPKLSPEVLLSVAPPTETLNETSDITDSVMESPVNKKSTPKSESMLEGDSVMESPVNKKSTPKSESMLEGDSITVTTTETQKRTKYGMAGKYITTDEEDVKVTVEKTLPRSKVSSTSAPKASGPKDDSKKGQASIQSFFKKK